MRQTWRRSKEISLTVFHFIVFCSLERWRIYLLAYSQSYHLSECRQIWHFTKQILNQMSPCFSLKLGVCQKPGTTALTQYVFVPKPNVVGTVLLVLMWNTFFFLQVCFLIWNGARWHLELSPAALVNAAEFWQGISSQLLINLGVLRKMFSYAIPN